MFMCWAARDTVLVLAGKTRSPNHKMLFQLLIVPAAWENRGLHEWLFMRGLQKMLSLLRLFCVMFPLHNRMCHHKKINLLTFMKTGLSIL